MSELLDWNNKPIQVPEKHENPCIDKYGPGPKGKICRDCTHLHGYHQSATWYKCDLREKYARPGGDHRVRWSACARFEEETAS